jgi:MinD-like ATPase involved in chromosome partitioning or flagellar assembly
MEGHVFISYVHENSPEVDQLEQTLEEAGIPVWRDTANLWPGDDWRAKIKEAITKDALVFIICFSQESAARAKSVQNEELTWAIEELRLRRPGEPWLIPVRFDDSEIPDSYIGPGRTLTSIQRADLFGDSFDDEIDRLITTVRRILEQHTSINVQAVSNWIATKSGAKSASSHESSTAPDRTKGRIATFYSYKRRTGRTMALANIGWILAANGLRVLLADCDLESPTLHALLRPFLGADTQEKPGTVDLIRSYEGPAAKAAEKRRIREVIPQHACAEPYVTQLNREFPCGGGLYFLPSGCENHDRKPLLASPDWATFYRTHNGGDFFDALGSDMRYHYDYTLIDSPAGMNDLVDILTVQIPDLLIDCFTFNRQSIDGAAKKVKSIKERYQDRVVQIFPVPMRVDSRTEYEAYLENRQHARTLFADLLAMPESQWDEYWETVEVPNIPYYEFAEKLAVFEGPGDPTSLLTAYEHLAAWITDGGVTGLPPLAKE